MAGSKGAVDSRVSGSWVSVGDGRFSAEKA